MYRKNLTEITKNKIGTGLLFENDGYISMDHGENKKIYETYKRLNEDRADGEDFHCPHPFIVSAVFQKFGIENANGRIYPEEVLKSQVEEYKKKIDKKLAYGELNHPSESTIDLGRIAMNIVELHWENNTLVGKLEIITTPGYRKHGICSSMGDQMANLLLSGLKIGVSSRGVGSVDQKMGKYIVGNDYELICWDVVSDPSTPNAWIESSDEELRPYIESNEHKGKQMFENSSKFSKFSSWLND